MDYQDDENIVREDAAGAMMHAMNFESAKGEFSLKSITSKEIFELAASTVGKPV